ncbi:ABC transporter substrate-binding protein [Streptomyces sp. NPDC091217]|uniref:ABC transporter substrate-binding protein n=1 Tax=Streptomyces sp. NPDC091217 TaxID=3365975 RepID=UPI0038174BE9
MNDFGIPRRTLLGGALAAAAGATLSGCAGGGGAAGGGSTVGDTLTLVVPSGASTLDPAGGQNAFNQFYDLAYDSLLVQKVDGTYAPGLATAWEYAPGNKKFSLTLRKGVKFSDGTALDAQAVKTWIEHALKLPGSAAPNYLGSLSGITVTDPQHLTLNFGKPTPQLEAVFSQALEMGMIGSPAAVKANSLQNATAGAGQYVLDKARTVSGDHYTFTPNPHYWNPSAIRWKKIVIRVMANATTVLQSMKSGQVQFAAQQPLSSITPARQAGLQVTGAMQSFQGLAINDRAGTVVPALGKLEVRQAINHALDRKAINQAVYGGHGQPTAQPAIDGDDGYDASLDDLYPYDPGKAKQLLKRAGYPNGFKVSLVAAAGLGMDQLAQAVAGQLAKVGITVTIDTKSTLPEYFNALSSGKYGLSTIGFGGLPAYFLYQLLIGPNAALFNPFKTHSAQLDDWYQQLLPLTAEAGKPVARKMVRYVTEQAWFAPVVATPLVALSAKGVTGANASTTGRRLWYLPELKPSH